jgi:glycosyltransferase involved in cell wall biosynthesis
MRAAALVPAYQAALTVGSVVRELGTLWPERSAIIVVDDGSTDDTGRVAAQAGALVLRHPANRGKGAALRTGLREAARLGFDVAVSVDADGQHPAREAVRLRGSCPNPAALVVGVRDLAAAQAPRANQRSNAFSNLAVSCFAWAALRDTQCGLRRYPIATTLALDGRADGYGYEAEVLIRAVAAGVPIVHQPVRVHYPPEEERRTHFDPVWDPTWMVFRVIATSAATRFAWIRSRVGPRLGSVRGRPAAARSSSTWERPTS